MPEIVSEIDSIFISEEESSQRLDKILAQRFTGIQSRTYFQMLIQENRVLVNGNPIKKRFQPSAGDEVCIHFILTPELNLNPEPIPLDILYEDEELILVNKPVGLVVHPAVGHWSGTFVNGLLYHCKHLPESSSLRPGIVHRLDKDTSGVLIAAKTIQTQQKLIEMFSKHEIYKEYMAICIGNPGNCTINAPIGRHPIHRKKMAVSDNGRNAESIVKTLAYNEKFSLVSIVLKTGRTHQIRVHLQHTRTPVLGDDTYGNSSINEHQKVKRQLLHAKLLRLKHPMSGKTLECTAPYPADMKTWINRFQI